MTLRASATAADMTTCQWISLREALRHFSMFEGATQSQQHIKPLHWYVACRLVVEGGFHPDDVTPRPPFTVSIRGSNRLLHFDPSRATGGERTVLGGLKTKNVDVVVAKDGIGPVLAISCKGMTGAFRNLTNRMEETIGECTNLHITYPAMVFGYMFVIRANRQPTVSVAKAKGATGEQVRQLGPNDIAMQANGTPAESIFRFHEALRELTGRRGIRNDLSRYEAVALAMIESTGKSAGDVLREFPPTDSPLRIEEFFKALYMRYEERYLLGAPELRSVTKRIEWAQESPAFDSSLRKSEHVPELDYPIRLDLG